MAFRDDPTELVDLLRRAATDRKDLWNGLVETHRPRLVRIVSVHLDRRIQGRFDAEDVVQAALTKAYHRLDRYLLDESRLPFFLWLRFLAIKTLHENHREHLGVRARDARREVSLTQENRLGPSARSVPDAVIANHLGDIMAGSLTTPSQVAMKQERAAWLHAAIGRLEPNDREILILRNFEQLTNDEAATFLGLKKSAASRRFLRAMTRLKALLEEISAGLDGI